MGIRIYPHPDRSAHGGIPVAGEIYDADDARRLIGAGLAVRRPSTAKAKTSPRAKPPAPPVKEG